MSSLKSLTALALLVAALGIVVQILGGNVAGYPAVPPGLVILLAAAAIVGLAPWRWAAAVGVLVSLFMIVGLFASDQASRLVDVETALDTAGLWLQMVAVVVALVAGVLTLVRRPSRARDTVEGGSAVASRDR